MLEAQRTASTINQQDLKGSYKFRVGEGPVLWLAVLSACCELSMELSHGCAHR